MANLTIKISGGAERAKDEAAERVVYKDVSQHARNRDGSYSRQDAIHDFLVRTAREGGVESAMKAEDLNEFIAKFVGYAQTIEDMEIPKGAFEIFHGNGAGYPGYSGFSLTEERVVEIYRECIGGIGYKVRELVNVDAIRNSLKQIFTWIPGERVINPTFGSNVRLYIYEQLTDLNQERITAEIRQCVTQWEPRVSIEKIQILTDVDDAENSTSRVQVVFKVIGLNDEQFSYVI